MANEKLFKYIDLTQSIITRMANNSFLMKGWCVTLVVGLFALSAKDSNPYFILVAFLPVLMFWSLDAYYLAQERMYRSIYNRIRNMDENAITFDLAPKQEDRTSRTSWWASACSITELSFYGIILIAVAIVALVTLLHTAPTK